MGPHSRDEQLGILASHIAYCTSECFDGIARWGQGGDGDVLDARATERAYHEPARVLAPGGSPYFSVPVPAPGCASMPIGLMRRQRS
jgi:hypothetical protein